MKKRKYFSNIIYGLDIETTTIELNDKKGSFMYSFCVGCLNLDNNNYKNLYLGRTYNDLDNYLFNLNETAIEEDKQYIIYIHNFSYEFSFFSNNSKFFKQYNKNDIKQNLFLKANKPLYVRCGNLEFRCSYLLLDKSIRGIGKDIGLDKLDFNYTKIRTPLTKLEDKEIEYNYRDVEIMLKGVYRLYNLNEYIKNANQIPYTKTGIMRFNCEQNPKVNVINEYTDKHGEKKKGKCMRLNKFLCGLEKAKSEKQLLFWEMLFQGGLVYSNAKYIGDVLHNLASFDFASDYPFQMLTRYFPSEFEEYKGNNKIMLEKCLRGVSEKNLIYNKPLRTMFNAIVVLNNIKSKFEFTPIGTSKIEEIEPLRNMLNCKIINGKIHEINTPIKMYVTCIDMITLQLFYDFDLLEVEYLEVAKRYRKSNQFKINSILYLAKRKIEFKIYNELVENMNTYHIYTEKEIQDEHFMNMINNENNYFNQMSTAKKLYLDVKSDLNALYGDNAQHLLHERFYYDDIEREWKSELETFEEYKNAQHKTSYIYGLYVPQYARASILYIAYKFITNGLNVYYIDTDSIKTDNTPLAHKLVKDFNKLQMINLKGYEWTKFGQLEHEYTAIKFASLGTKSYIKLEYDKQNNPVVKATISGLPNATELYNKLFEYYEKNFEELVECCYHYGTVFDKSVVNKLASKYDFFDFEVNIDNYKDFVCSGVVLEPVDVTMRDFISKTWYSYARLICMMYDKDFDIFCRKTIIKLNMKGEIEIEHKTK